MGREFICFTLQALVDAEADLVLDACWTLHMLCKRCTMTPQWIQESDGLCSIRRSMLTHAGNEKIVLCGAWIVHTLAGLGGLAALLSSSGSTSDTCANLQLDSRIVASIVWVIYEVLASEQGKHLPPESPTLVHLILGHLAPRVDDRDVVEACCLSLEVMVKQEPDVGKLLVELGATPLLVQALSRV